MFVTLALSLAVISCLDRGTAPAGRADAVADSLPDTVYHKIPKVEIVIERALLFEKYALADTFPYRDTVRVIQWDKITRSLEMFDSMLLRPTAWCVLGNRHNRNGIAPMARVVHPNDYKNVSDAFGVERRNAIPLYLSADSLAPECYTQDGSLARLFSPPGDSLAVVEPLHIGGRWTVPSQYVRHIVADTLDPMAQPAFDHAIFVDRHNQYIVTLQRESPKWLVRSVNPCTTGRRLPPYQYQTPRGVFAIQEKKKEMIFLKDGTTDVREGFAPFASRFSNGGYIHGVPVNYPRTETIEWSWTLGTTPRSHMCVRNATSHAEFIFNWAPTLQTAVFIFE
ncbi:MAG: L,D-transpeptidase [Rikenellaceae bacterium]|nr:L,D-transpeptidase [Rikenellaceae bacterium]